MYTKDNIDGVQFTSRKNTYTVSLIQETEFLAKYTKWKGYDLFSVFS